MEMEFFKKWREGSYLLRLLNFIDNSLVLQLSHVDWKIVLLKVMISSLAVSILFSQTSFQAIMTGSGSIFAGLIISPKFV